MTLTLKHFDEFGRFGWSLTSSCCSPMTRLFLSRQNLFELRVACDYDGQ
jgi:hypothetical protein